MHACALCPPAQTDACETDAGRTLSSDTGLGCSPDADEVEDPDERPWSMVSSMHRGAARPTLPEVARAPLASIASRPLVRKDCSPGSDPIFLLFSEYGARVVLGAALPRGFFRWHAAEPVQIFS